MKKNCVFLLLFAALAAACGQRDSIWSSPEMWYQSENVYDASRIDVLYFVSTEVLSAEDAEGRVSWRSQLVPEDLDAMRGEIAWVEKNMFREDFNLSAPYYHQFTFDALCQLDGNQFNEVYRQVAEEACQAFDYYMENENGGRPFILAGFSQGAMLTLDVLRHMSDEQYSRMIACYTIGYRLSADDLRHPHIKAATDESGRGVVISFNSTQTRDAIWPLVGAGAAVCINPFNWRTDDTPASFNFNGTSNTVHVDTGENVLIVETDDPQYYCSYYDAATFYQDAGVSPYNLHHWDLLFYAGQIHDNALLRSR